MGNFIDLTGKRFGRLIVIKKTDQHKGYEILWDCLCDCGKHHLVRGKHLREGLVKSCGCLRSEKGRNHTHGLRYTRLYTIWKNVKSRCNNPKSINYKDYGGRGIVCCKEWMDFETFYQWAMANGYKEGLTIERIDNDKGYNPENCRWATLLEQARNKRSNHFLIYKGEARTISEWEEYLGMHRGTLNQRIAKGWSVRRAIETPVRKRPKS